MNEISYCFAQALSCTHAHVLVLSLVLTALAAIFVILASVALYLVTEAKAPEQTFSRGRYHTVSHITGHVTAEAVR